MKKSFSRSLVNVLFGARTESAKKVKAVKLGLETLEQRQLLSVNSCSGDVQMEGEPPAEIVSSVGCDEVITFDANELATNGWFDNDNNKSQTSTFKGITNDSDYHGFGSPIIFSINIDDGVAIDTNKQATLRLYVHDVDYAQGEVDYVYVNGNKLSGMLTGADQSWSTPSFTFDSSYLKPGTNTIRIDPSMVQRGWVVRCDWGEISCSVAEVPDISVKSISLACIDPIISSKWGAVVGQTVELKATIQENTSEHDLNDYTLVSAVWKLEKLDANGVSTGVSKTFVAKPGDWSEIMHPADQDNCWDIIYLGWTPQKGEHGTYSVTCTLNYKINGSGWLGKLGIGGWLGNLGAKTYSSSRTEKADVGVTEYGVFITECKNDSFGYSLVAENYVNTSYTVSRDWYENEWSTCSASTESQKIETLFDELQIKYSESKVTDFLNLFTDEKDVVLFGKVGKNGKIACDSLGIVENRCDVVGSFHVEGEDVDEETLARYVAYARESNGNGGSQAGDWTKGNRLWWFDYTGRYVSIDGEIEYVYEKDKSNSFTFTKYTIDEVFHNIGFDAYGLTCCKNSSSNDKSSVLAIRGTASFYDLVDDTNPKGVGFNEFNSNYQQVQNWLDKQKQEDRSISITAHSLGGALAQWIASEWTSKGNKLNKVTTFNSPGISKQYADKCVTSNINQVVHHISVGDIVSLAGEAHIKGVVKLYSYTPASSFVKNSADYLLSKHTLPLINNNIPFNQKTVKGITSKTISTDDLNSFWFHYNDEQYTKYYAGIDQVAFIRGTTEYGRKIVGNSVNSGVQTGVASYVLTHSILQSLIIGGIGALGSGIVLATPYLLNSATLTSNNGWSLKDINTDYNSSLPGDIKYENGTFSGEVDIRTPNGFSLPGVTYYSDFGLKNIKVERNTKSEVLKLGSSFYVEDANLTLSGIEQLRKMNATYPQNLPNINYSLTGSLALSFGSKSYATKMCDIKLNALKTSSKSQKELLTDVAELNISYLGKPILDVTPSNSDFSFIGANCLSGKGDSYLTVYDYVLIQEKESSYYDWRPTYVTALNSSITFRGGIFKDSITITANTGSENEFMFKYNEDASPVLKYAGKIYNYNVTNARWESSSLPIVTSGIVEQNNKSSGVVDNLDVVVTDGTVVTVSVEASNIDAYSDVYFYLDTDSSGYDGEYMGSVSVSEMDLIDGKYVCSFDFAETGLEGGIYSIYAHGDFENEENATYSELFELQFDVPISISTTSCEFGDVNIGSSIMKQERTVTIINQSSTTQEFCICSESNDNFYYSGKYSCGDDLESYTVTLEAGESLTLSVYFLPTTMGNKTATVSFIDSEGKSLGTVELSGKALAMLPTEIGTSSENASLSTTEVRTGDQLTINCNVVNLDVNTADATTVNFYISQNPDDITAGLTLGEEKTNWILEGQSETVSLNIPSFPDLTPGLYYIGWVVASSNDVDLSNNVAVFTQPICVLEDEDNTFTFVAENAVDEDSDGFYNNLVVKSVITVETEDDYDCRFTLSDLQGHIITTIEESKTLVVGANLVDVEFDGNAIFRSKLSGSYTLSVEISSESTNFFKSNAGMTVDYSYERFEGGQIVLSDVYSDSGVDSDQNGKYESLVVEVGVSVAKEGSYRLSGSLVDSNGNFIGYAYVERDLKLGNSNVSLSFDAVDLVSNGANGSLTLTNLFLQDVESNKTFSVSNDVYKTKVYSLTDFQTAGSVLTGENTFVPVDDDGNGLYDRLIIRIGVSVEQDGKYFLGGIVSDVNGTTIKVLNQTCNLTSDNTYVETSIEALDISDSGSAAPFRVTGLQLLDENGNLISYINSFTSDAYSSSAFERRTLFVSDEKTENWEIVSDNWAASKLNITFKAISENAGTFNANARIVNAVGDEVGWAYEIIALSANEETEVTLSFSYEDFLQFCGTDPFYVKDFSMYDTSGSNTYNSVFVSNFYEIQTPFNLNEPEWNLADYAGYKSFKLDATTDDNYTASLYGQEKDGTFTLLKAWDFVGADASAAITGDSKVSESLVVTASASKLLGAIDFNGGSGSRDSLFIEGTEGDDVISVGTEEITTTTPIYTSNPYEKILANYEKQLGATSKTYLRLKDCYDAAYARLAKMVKTTTSTYGIVDFEEGAKIQFIGVKAITVDAGAGNDVFDVEKLRFNYTFVGGEGTDALDFADVSASATVNLGAPYRQVPIAGDCGLMRLSDEFEGFVGSKFNDYVTAGAKGATIDGNGGSDSVVLVGGDNQVALTGKYQSIAIRGAGVYNVVLTDADESSVNASSAQQAARVKLDAVGNYIALYGGLGVVEATVQGDYASINCGATMQTTATIQGDYATIISGKGADAIAVVGDFATIYANGDDDFVECQGGGAVINLGVGSDVAFVSDGDDGKKGENFVYGESGDDFIFGANTTGRNYFYAGAGNDVIFGGAGQDYIYANSGVNALFGLGGVDRIYGARGRDVLAASRTSNLENVETASREELLRLYESLYENWIEEGDLEKTVELLGENSIADGVKDWLYTYRHSDDLVYANQEDDDFVSGVPYGPNWSYLD